MKIERNWYSDYIRIDHDDGTILVKEGYLIEVLLWLAGHKNWGIIDQHEFNAIYQSQRS